MTLDQLPIGDHARVRSLSGAPLLRERLTELGFLRDRAVRVLRRAPLGDPIYVRIRGGSFAVRREEAQCIRLDDEAARAVRDAAAAGAA